MRLVRTHDTDDVTVAERDCDLLVTQAAAAAPNVVVRDIFAGFRAPRSRAASKRTRSTSVCRRRIAESC